MPSLQLILSLDRKYHKNRFVISENIAIFENAAMSILKGDAINATPRMRVMLMKQLPTMLPRAKSKKPFRTELTLVANSGMLVPKATTVAPIMTGGTPTLAAMKEEDSTMKNAVAITTEAPASASDTYLRIRRFSDFGTPERFKTLEAAISYAIHSE